MNHIQTEIIQSPLLELLLHAPTDAFRTIKECSAHNRKQSSDSTLCNQANMQPKEKNI
jgi:hypothetical protein